MHDKYKSNKNKQTKNNTFINAHLCQPASAMSVKPLHDKHSRDLITLLSNGVISLVMH